MKPREQLTAIEVKESLNLDQSQIKKALRLINTLIKVINRPKTQEAIKYVGASAEAASDYIKKWHIL